MVYNDIRKPCLFRSFIFNKIFNGAPILGPLIFIIHVNYIFKSIVRQDDIIMYADNTLLLSSSNTYEQSVRACQGMLDEMMKWCDSNKLTINIKRKYICTSILIPKITITD